MDFYRGIKARVVQPSDTYLGLGKVRIPTYLLIYGFTEDGIPE